MVVKNTQVVTRATATRLPPLPKLRVRKPDQAGANPCVGVMSSVLSCWASSGYTTQGCAALEQQLRACMDAPVRCHPICTTFIITNRNSPYRKPSRTRRAQSTTICRDYIPKSSALIKGNSMHSTHHCLCIINIHPLRHHTHFRPAARDFTSFSLHLSALLTEESYEPYIWQRASPGYKHRRRHCSIPT